MQKNQRDFRRALVEELIKKLCDQETKATRKDFSQPSPYMERQAQHAHVPCKITDSSGKTFEKASRAFQIIKQIDKCFKKNTYFEFQSCS